ncbi:MAG: polyprenyl synthetase family protein [Bacteroidales bacterium]|nr:polyprenyl synthetase family protein [Bacteroidales bacterium]MBN2697619.1 polyprenyl synthetase family protein [Bacteroidales bacterium]
MYTLLEAQNLVERHLKTLKLPDAPAELYEPVKYILSIGGKRIRPALVLMSCDLFSGALESALNPAVAIEIFHNFTLMHDDIMDRSELRRGYPTVHIKYNENVAILSGDVMSILASRLINQSPGVVLHTVHEIFTRTAMEVCEGQQMDMNFEEKLTVTEEEYLRMIELKTAVLMAASLKMGAILGGASSKDAEDLYNFGRNLGIAFQLQDDLLDTYGDAGLVGKKTGTDIVDNKKTFLMVRALDIAGPEQKEELHRWLRKKEFDPEEKIKAVKSIFDALKIEQHAKEKIRAFYRIALEDLKSLNRQEERKKELFNFAEFLMNRQK